MYGENYEPQDICNWDKDIEADLIFHGSPCQDFSLAGKQAGGDEGSGTRSSLMYETIRIVEKVRPKYIIWENVKNVISKKHKHNFDNYLQEMSKLGYSNYYQVLNAKDYGIPQNRERVFTVSILGEKDFKFPKDDIQECEIINPLKDISGKSWQFEQNVYSENSILRSLKAGGGSGNIPKVIEHFEFPSKQELKLKLKDLLEYKVDEKYYLSEEKISKIANWRAYQKPFEKVQDELIGLFDDTSSDNFAKGKRDYGFKDEYGTLKCTPKYSIYKSTDLRIRKLTPKECWRLMGFDDEDFEKASKVCSNSQLYKQAGNSIVVNVLVEIIKKLNEMIVKGE